MSHLANKKLHQISNLSLASGSVIVSANGTDLTVQDGATFRSTVGLAIGTDVLAYDADVAALTTAFSGFAGPGVVSRQTDGSYSVRTITGTSDQIVVADGDGDGGNPTLSLPQSIATTSDVTFGSVTTTGNVIVGGNFTVSGSTTTISAEYEALATNYLILNDGYQNDSAQTVGIISIVDPTTTSTTVAGSYVAGVGATSNPTVQVSSTAGFAAGDIIQIASGTNKGIYEVKSLLSTPTRIEIRGVGTEGVVELFSQGQFTSGSSDSANITKVNIGIARFGTDGKYELSYGSASGLTYKDVFITAGNGLTSSTNTVSALSDATGGANLAKSVSVTSNGLAIKIDDATIGENGSARLFVKDNSIGPTQVDETANYAFSGVITTAGRKYAVANKTANYTASSADHVLICDPTSGSFTITLPAAAAAGSGMILIVKNIAGSNTVTLDANASETIDGATTAVAYYGASYTIICDGVAWFIL